MTDTAQITLPAADAAELAQHEAVIERGLQTFYEVGTALLAIRDKRLYRADYSTFEDYCRERWQMGRNYVNKLITAAEVVTNLGTNVPILPTTLPTTESQARELVGLDKEAQRLAWEVVQQTAPAGKVTAAHVKSVVSVLKEVVTTGAIDNGTGESVPVVADVLKAAVTEETYERMRRQSEYITAKQAVKEARHARVEERLSRIQTAPADVYSVIYADPPWQYANSGLQGAAEGHYPTMATDELCAYLQTLSLQVATPAVLFMWATNPLLEDALRVMNAWQFTYKTNLVWDKEQPGYGMLGFYVRGQHELLLIGTRGDESFLPMEKPISVIRERKSAHSRKPECVYELIESMYPEQRYIELFARQVAPRSDWTYSGGEYEPT